jgi:hypothetical protein
MLSEFERPKPAIVSAESPLVCYLGSENAKRSQALDVQVVTKPWWKLWLGMQAVSKHGSLVFSHAHAPCTSAPRRTGPRRALLG